MLQGEPQDMMNYTSLAEEPEDYLGKEWVSEQRILPSSLESGCGW